MFKNKKSVISDSLLFFKIVSESALATNETHLATRPDSTDFQIKNPDAHQLTHTARFLKNFGDEKSNSTQSHW
jgi:hypothetical protein